MVTVWHKRVQKHLIKIGEESPRSFRNVYNDRRPIHFNHPMKKSVPLLYYPDARYETKTGRVYLFEVMDTEADSQAQIVAHVLEAYFTPQALKVFFIVQSEPERDTVAHITEIVIAKLLEMSQGALNTRIRFYHVVITPQDSKSKHRVAEILRETRRVPVQ